MVKMTEAEHRFLDGIDACIYLVDPEGRLMDANTSWQIFFGFRIDFVRGQPIKELLRSMIYARSGKNGGGLPWEFEAPAALEAIRTGLPATTTLQKGTSTVTARPVFDEQGALSYVICTVNIYRSQQDRMRIISTGMYHADSRLLGQSEQILRVRKMIQRVAPTDATVLILGPSGCGKEVVANEIQRHSSRAAGPFVKVNCSAFPEQLLESELFGYEAGAFTGAAKGGKNGLLDQAEHGTLLLDEIGEMPMFLQPKLLRFLQERTYVRVGGVKERRADVRILAATNVDLKQAIQEKKFREDLFYRLNVISFHMPSLNQNRSDIPELAEHALAMFNQKYDRSCWFGKDALPFLQRCDWPGNVRQLENIIERTVVMNVDAELTAEILNDMMQWNAEDEPTERSSLKSFVSGEASTLKDATDALQRKMIEDALLECGSTYRAADRLGISQSTLVRRTKQLGICVEKAEEGE